MLLPVKDKWVGAASLALGVWMEGAVCSLPVLGASTGAVGVVEGSPPGNHDGTRGMQGPLWGTWDGGSTDQLVRWDLWVNLSPWPL